MIRITIDGIQIEVAEGGSVLDAARAAGVEIPTLCHLPGHDAKPSCYLCMVRIDGSPRLVPACATRAVDGMQVRNDDEDVREARRTAIELLLSDHLGDCFGPCQSVCPAHMDAPTMMRQIAAGRFREALVTVKASIALPATLGRICPEICEKACRRGAVDGSVSVCKLKRFVADVDLRADSTYVPACAPPSGMRVAIVGAGPAGLSAAYYLLLQGHACTLYDDHDQPGGMLRYGVPEEDLPRDVLDGEIEVIRSMGLRFEGGVRVGAELSLDALRRDFDAVLIAVGDVRRDGCPDMGLDRTPQGIGVDRRTMRASLPDVFVAGSAIVPSRTAVRAVADGRAAAESIARSLGGSAPDRGSREFGVHVGRLGAEETAPYLRIASPASRVAPAGGARLGFTEEEARLEASRCLHCDCRGAGNCKLRQYGRELGADASRFKGERRPFSIDDSHPLVVFEPGKCVACGICVRVAAEHGEKLGMSFIGRGFSVRTSVPFNEPLSQGLKGAARACAEACPTGALALREES